jgi:hypothetical protein
MSLKVLILSTVTLIRNWSKLTSITLPNSSVFYKLSGYGSFVTHLIEDALNNV